MSSQHTRFYDVDVWLKGLEEDATHVIIETIPPLTPLNVRDYCCRTEVFLWKEYTRIRYRRVARREEKK